jgi:hypothetical protein
VKIDHAGECWESASYKQEKVTEACTSESVQGWEPSLCSSDSWTLAH